LRGTVTGRWRRLQNEKLYDLYCSPINIRVIKSRRTRWAGQVGGMGAKTTFIKGVGGKTYWKHRLEDLHIEERIILKWTFKNWYGGTDCVDLAQDTARRRTFVNAVMNCRMLYPGRVPMENVS